MSKKYLNAQNMMNVFNDGFYLQHVNNIVIHDMQNSEGEKIQAIATCGFWQCLYISNNNSISQELFPLSKNSRNIMLRFGSTLLPSAGETSGFT
jgi:hypothetical protein